MGFKWLTQRPANALHMPCNATRNLNARATTKALAGARISTGTARKLLLSGKLVILTAKQTWPGCVDGRWSTAAPAPAHSKDVKTGTPCCEHHPMITGRCPVDAPSSQLQSLHRLVGNCAGCADCNMLGQSACGFAAHTRAERLNVHLYQKHPNTVCKEPSRRSWQKLGYVLSRQLSLVEHFSIGRKSWRWWLLEIHDSK